MASGTAGTSLPSSPLAPPDRSNLAERERFIERQLRKTRSQLRGVELTSRFMLLGAAALAYFLAVAVVDHWLVPGGLSIWGRLACLAVFLLAAAGYATRQLAPVLLHRVNPVYAAHTIERSKPSLKNSLVNFLLLRSHRAGVPDVVYQAVEEQAAANLTRTPIDHAVDRSGVIHMGYVLVALLSLFALYYVFSPKSPLETVARVVLPWADINPPTRVSIHEVRPGSDAVFRGEPVTISAEVRRLGSDEPATLIYSTADRQIAERPVRMYLPKDSIRHEVVLPEEDSAAASLAAGGMQQDIEYRIEAGDAVSPTYKLSVIQAPNIVVERVEYAYPKYTGEPPRSVAGAGDLRALDGTVVTIHALANQPIRTAYVEFDGDGRSRKPMTTNGQDARVSFPLTLKADRSGPAHSSYAIRFVNEHGKENLEPIRHKIEVFPDRAPEIAFSQPANSEIEVPLDGSAALAVEARDLDYGLSQVRISANVRNQPLFERTPLHTADEKGRQGRFTATEQFRPARLKVGQEPLREGDVVEYWAEATDNQTPDANVSKTEVRRIRIAPPKNRNQQPPNDPQQQPQDGGQEGNGQPQDKPNQQGQPSEPRDGQNQNPDQNQNPNQNPGQKNPRDPQPNQNQRPDQKQSPSDQPKDPGGAQNNQEQDGGGDQQNGDQKNGGQGKSSKSPKANSDQKQDNSRQNSDTQQNSDGKNQSGNEQNTGSEQNPSEPSGQPGAQQDQNSGSSKQDGSRSASNREGSSENPSGKAGQNPQQDNPSPTADGKGQQDGKSAANPTESQKNGAGGHNDGSPKQGSPADRQQSPQQRPQDDGQTRDPSANNQSGANQSGNDPAGDNASAPNRSDGKSNPSQRPSQPVAKDGDDGRALERILEHRRQAEQNQSPESQKSGPPDPSQSPPDANAQPQNTEPQKGQPQENPSKEGANSGTPTKDGQQKDGQANAGQPDAGQPANQKSDKAKSDDQESPTREPQPADGKQPPENSDPANQKSGAPGETSKTGNQKQDSGQAKTSKSGGQTPQSQQDSRPANSKSQPGNPDGADKSDEQSPAHGNKDSDTQSDSQGDRKGDGKQGGGQQKNQPGKGTAGQNEAADDGAGASTEPGQGESANEPGDKTGRGKSGKSSDQKGNGSRQSQGSPSGSGDKDGSPPSGKQPNGQKSDAAEGAADRKGSDRKTDPKGNPANRDSADPKSSPAQQGEPQDRDSKSGPNQDQKSKSEGDKSSPPGDTANGANSGEPQPGQPSPVTGEPVEAKEDQANLEYAKKATNLALDHLRNQLRKGEPDQKLLQKLGNNWSKEDLQRLVERWEKMERDAQLPGPEGAAGKRKLDDALQSLGIRPDVTRRAATRRADDAARGLRESSRLTPPPEYAEQFRAFQQGTARGQK